MEEVALGSRLVPSLPMLEPPQRAVVEEWFPGAVLIVDHSWGLVGRTVLHLRYEGRDFVLKAGAFEDHHMVREIVAHFTMVEPLAGCGLAPRLVQADRGLRLLATTYLPGVLVEGTPAEYEPGTYRQAGHALALFHGQGARPGDEYEQRMDAKALAWLNRDHRIADEAVALLRAELATPLPPRPLAPTHGDWQPRNWIVDGARLAVIDFGRADWRPPGTDLARLGAQQFRGRPDLVEAFLDGYGNDPRTPQAWRRDRVREAIGTAVWAHLVADDEFEQQGHRMIANLLDADH